MPVVSSSGGVFLHVTVYSAIGKALDKGICYMFAPTTDSTHTVQFLDYLRECMPAEEVGGTHIVLDNHIVSLGAPCPLLLDLFVFF